MFGTPITEHEIGQILKGSIEVFDDVIWQRKRNNNWYESILKVKHSQPRIRLEMRLSVNDLDRNKYSFSLLWDIHRIRGLDVAGSHRNNHTDNNRWNQELHKHKWTDICRDSWAYTPDNFLTRTMEESFKEFCRECGITFNGKWANPPDSYSQMIL